MRPRVRVPTTNVFRMVCMPSEVGIGVRFLRSVPSSPGMAVQRHWYHLVLAPAAFRPYSREDALRGLGSISPDHAHHDSLDVHVPGDKVHGVQRLIGRLEPDAAIPFPVELLDGG